MHKTIRISIDDELILELDDWQVRALCHDIPEELIHGDLANRIRHIVAQKIRQSLTLMRQEWEKELDLPRDSQDMCELVFSQENYLSRRQKEQRKNIEETENLWHTL